MQAQVHGAGERPCLLERRNGITRGSQYRPTAGNRSSRKSIPSEAQRRLSTLLPASGYSAYRLVFGSIPADLFGWGRDHENPLLAQNAPLPGQRVQQWKSHGMAQEAALKGVTRSMLRRLSGYTKSFNRTDVRVGDSFLIRKASKREIATR